jgi:hypothetical protein
MSEVIFFCHHEQIGAGTPKTIEGLGSYGEPRGNRGPQSGGRGDWWEAISRGKVIDGPLEARYET